MESLKIINNRYQLLTIVKKGGFGIIYKGYDSVLGKDIAVKEIKPELTKDPWFIDQFQIEARHVAKMNHQNIVHIFDLVQTEGNEYYIVMEYINGLDLSTLIQECRKRGQLIPKHLAIHIVAEVCKALDYAHNCSNSENNDPINLVHKDISPSNIMISSNGIVKLIDFGIAGVQKKSISDKNYVPLQGKIQYMSPEHVGHNVDLDKRSDIFSLGLVLYEILEGKRFFSGDNIYEILETLRNGKLKLKDLKQTPKPLQNVLQKALEKLPEKRYQNANQFYIDLVTFLVLNKDTSSIDQEISDFIANISNNQNSEKDDFFISRKSDKLYDNVLDEIGEKYPENKIDRQQADPNATKEDVDNFETAFNESAGSSSAQVEFDAITVDDDIEIIEPVEDEIKTVIDVVRLATRGHNKLFMKYTVGILSLSLLLFIFDISFQWTSFGTSIYDFLFPPAIKISTIPAGAKIFLDDKPLAGVTPISIDKINPGVHELKLTTDGYRPVFKSIYIPSKGQIKIKGEPVRRGNQPYIFRFKTTFELDSMPQGAEVYINNIKYGQNTPCSVTWEVGEEFQIELRKSGFNSLSGFGLDTEKMIEDIDDRRLWDFEVLKKPTTIYKIKRLFGKFITIKSNPSNALIYLDGNPNPIGDTDNPNKIFLTATSHNILLKKKGYNQKTIDLEVNEDTPSQVVANLFRPVRFSAYDATNGNSTDLNAFITQVVRNGRIVFRKKRTPITLNLIYDNYYAIFTKDGYNDIKVPISPRDKRVTARMETLNAQVSVVIINDVTGAPLSNVEIRFKSLDDHNSSEGLFNITDLDGTCSNTLQPGLYLFRTSKNAYKYQEKSVMIQSTGLNLIEFNLIAL